MFCLHRNSCIYTVCMKSLRSVSNYHLNAFFLQLITLGFQLPSTDEMKLFYTERDFQFDLENFEFNLKSMQKEYNKSNVYIILGRSATLL